MKKINLTKGYVTLVDDADYEWLAKRKWHAKENNGKNIYAGANFIIDGKKRGIRMHRYILGVLDDDCLVDHIDGDSLNNQRSNLRICDHSQNSWNRKYQSDSVGARLNKKTGLWQVHMALNGRSLCLKGLSSKDSALYVYNESVKFYRKDFATLNPIDVSKVDFDDIRKVFNTPRYIKGNHIYWDKSKDLWLVIHVTNKKRFILGRFKKLEDAQSCLAQNQDKIDSALLQRYLESKSISAFYLALRNDKLVFPSS